MPNIANPTLDLLTSQSKHGSKHGSTCTRPRQPAEEPVDSFGDNYGSMGELGEYPTGEVKIRLKRLDMHC